MLCLAGLLFSFPVAARAESLEFYLKRLVDEHHLIGAVKNKTEASEHKKRAAEAGYYPSVRFSSNAGYESIDDDVDEDSDLFKTTNSLKASQLLYDFGATTSTVEIAGIEEQLSRAEQQQTTQLIIFNGIQAYINVARQIQKLIYANTTENNFKKQVKAETSMENQGAGRASDVLQVKAQLSGAIANRIRIEGELEQAVNEFETIFQTNLSKPEAMSFTIPSPPVGQLAPSLDEALTRAFNNNPGLLVEQFRSRIGGQQVHRAEAGLWPKLDLTAESKYNHNDQGTEGDRFENFVGLELNYAVFSGGRDSAKILEAQANRAFLQRRYEHARLLVKKLVRENWQKMKTLEDTSRIYEEQAVQTADFLLLAKKERKMGSRSVIDVLNAENVYFSALNNAIVSQADYVLSMFSLLHAMGTLDGDGYKM